MKSEICAAILDEESAVKKYCETEKNHHMECAVHKNNKILFDMIKDHVDHLISKRLMDFCEIEPIASQFKKSSTVYYKE